MDRIVLASASPKKVAELQALLQSSGLALQVVPRPAGIADVVEDAPDFLGNARLKAAAIAAATGEWALADDSGLEVDALDGAPGVRSARFAGESATDSDNVELLLSQLEQAGAVEPAQRTARFRCCIVVQSPPDPSGAPVTELVAEAAVEGVIVAERHGEAGFGYDPVFVPNDEPSGRTFAQMTGEEKAAISHRGRALRALAPQLSALTT